MITIAQDPRAEARLELQRVAERLYPRNRALQAEWLRAVTVVRSTKRGWVLDMPATITGARRHDA